MNRKLVSLIISALFVTVIILRDTFYWKFWILAALPILVTFIGILMVIFLNIRKDKNAVYISLIALLIGLSVVIVEDTELFKSKIVIKAISVSELSYLELILRENKKFELLPESYLGRSESITGYYKIDGNRIIFLNNPFKERLIKDTVFIINNKVILSLDSLGNPDTTSANYFKIDNFERNNAR